ncbi:MAG: aminobenzoyl-glutamate transporter [Acidobacteria bacterium]|nr:aminobenzoyl-glutamate transporter [Acidobacteriota bacterium]|tara:strand:+ start:25977 stop:27518 length:1542 start_codon:yes stop_codon:yes gene_type:complete
MRQRTEVLRRALTVFLSAVERGGNTLPHPGTLFAILAGLTVVISAIAAKAELEVIHPGTGELIQPVSLATVQGLHRILTEMVTNFTSFAPLGTVLVAMLGIGVMESSGLIGAALRLLVLSAPKRLLTFVIVLAGVLSNTASEIGYVLLVPLGGIIFLGAGRHPIAGLAAAFAGVSGGYSANLLLGTVDPLLAGLSEEAARIVDDGYRVNAAANYYFMTASTFMVAGVGTWVTERIVIPRLGPYKGSDNEDQPEVLQELTSVEKRGLAYTLLAVAIFVAFLLWGTVPTEGFLRNPDTGGLLRSPFLSGIVAFIFLGGTVVGITYGAVVGVFRNDTDVMNGMGKTISTLGTYLVLVFFAAQFVAYFNWTNLGLIMAVKGAEGLRSSGLGGIPLMVSFVLLSAFINLFMGSASAKWAIMAPIFVPMFMLLGYSPELTQTAYRIGDSTSNIIAPMMSYFALIVAFFERYDNRSGIGTVVATMLPYTLAFLACWSVLLVIWMWLGLPVGPGAGLSLQP